MYGHIDFLGKGATTVLEDVMDSHYLRLYDIDAHYIEPTGRTTVGT